MVSKPKNSRNRLSFGLFRFEPRKKINGLEYPLIDNLFWGFFWFVSVCLEKILFVSVVSILVRNTETNRNQPKKMFFGFAKQTEKQPKQIEFRFVTVRTEKNILLFRGHPSGKPQRRRTRHQAGRRRVTTEPAASYGL